jgi:integrase
MLFNVSTQSEIFDGTNPVKRTDPIRSDCARVRRRLSQEELARLLRACRADDTPRGWMWTTFFQVMTLSGLRVREAALLRWEDFYWRDGVYRPSHQKRSNGYDILPLTMELESVLAEWSGGREQRGLVFPAVTRCGGKRFCDQARRALKEYAREAALPNPETLGTHAFRRTFITQAADAARGDHVALMQVARHQNFETTRLYMPTVSKAVQEVSTAVAHALGATLGISEIAHQCARSSNGAQARLPGIDAARCIPALRSRYFDSARQLRLSFE